MEKHIFGKITCLSSFCTFENNEIYLCIHKNCNSPKIVCGLCKKIHENHLSDVRLLSEFLNNIIVPKNELKEKLKNSGFWIFDDETINKIANESLEEDIKKIDEICLSFFKSIRIILERMKNEFKQKIIKKRIEEINHLLKFYKTEINFIFSTEDIANMTKKNFKSEDQRTFTQRFIEKIDAYSSRIKNIDFSFLDDLNKKLLNPDVFAPLSFSDNIFSETQKKISSTFLNLPSLFIDSNIKENSGCIKEIVPRNISLYKNLPSNHNTFLNSIKTIDNIMFSSDISGKIVVWSFPKMNPIEIISSSPYEKAVNFLKIISPNKIEDDNDGSIKLITGGDNGILKFWVWKEKRLKIEELVDAGDFAYLAEVFEKGKFLAVQVKFVLKIYDLKSKKVVKSLDESKLDYVSALTLVEYSTQNKFQDEKKILIIRGDVSGKIGFWDLNKKELYLRMKQVKIISICILKEMNKEAISFLKDDGFKFYFAVAYEDSSIQIFNSNKKVIRQINDIPGITSIKFLNFEEEMRNSLNCKKNTKFKYEGFLVIGTFDKKIYIFDFRTGRLFCKEYIGLKVYNNDCLEIKSYQTEGEEQPNFYIIVGGGGGIPDIICWVMKKYKKLKFESSFKLQKEKRHNLKIFKNILCMFSCLLHFSLILIFIPFLFCQSNEETPKVETFYTSNLYDPNGYCSEPDEDCFPTKNITFSNIWRDYSKQDLVNMINRRLDAAPFPNKLRAGLDSDDIHLFAKEKIQYGELLTSFDIEKTLTCLELNLNLFEDNFVESFKEFGKVPKILLDEKQKNFQNFINLALNLLAHLYNFQHSKIKDMILLLPQKIEDYFPFEVTYYEAKKFLQGDDFYDKLGVFKGFVHQSYKYLKQTINTFWPAEIIHAILHTDNIPYQDFVYVAYVFTTRYIDSVLPTVLHNSKSYSNKHVSLLLSVQLKDKEDIPENTIYQIHEFQIEKIEKVSLGAGRDFEAGEKIELQFSRSGFAEKIISGIRNFDEFTFNNRECFDVVYFGKDVEETYKHESKGCISLDMVYHFYTLGNLMNMVGKEYSDCVKGIKALNIPGNVNYSRIKDNYIEENCTHPEWKTNIFKFTKLQLDERFDNFHYNLKRIEEYVEFRKERHLSTNAVEFIRDYLKIKIKLLNAFYKEFKKYEKRAKDKFLEEQQNLNKKLEF